MEKKLLLMFLLIIILLAACSGQATPTPEQTTPASKLPNPASGYCEEAGGTLKIRTAEDGSQSGLCIFPNGSECDEWAFFRGECAPAEQEEPAAEELDPGWALYQDPKMGFYFQYPADAAIQLDSNGYSIYVNGPVVDNNSWPFFMISYPTDREEYHVPEGADLKTWLIDHNLYLDQPRPDRKIAGLQAVHSYYPGGQQSYAGDRYYFVQQGQMFVIGILHTGDREDWELYNHFLDSFKFE